MSDFDSDPTGAWAAHTHDQPFDTPAGDIVDDLDAATFALSSDASGFGGTDFDDATPFGHHENFAGPDADTATGGAAVPTMPSAPGVGVLPDIDLTDTDDLDPIAALQEPAPPSAPNAAEDGVHGNPVEWSLNWFYQQLDGYCGPAVVGQIVAEYTGQVITDPQQLVDRAVELGLTVSGDPTSGMTLPNIEALLEDQGVPSTITTSSMDELRSALDDGRAVIAMVDSGEIWNPNAETSEDNTPDHVLVVAGIDDDRGVVILSDPGNPGGNQLEVPIDQFEDAWADSGQQILVADAPDPDLLPGGTAGLNTDTRRRPSVVIEL